MSADAVGRPESGTRVSPSAYDSARSAHSARPLTHLSTPGWRCRNGGYSCYTQLSRHPTSAFSPPLWRGDTRRPLGACAFEKGRAGWRSATSSYRLLSSLSLGGYHHPANNRARLSHLAIDANTLRPRRQSGEGAGLSLPAWTPHPNNARPATPPFLLLAL